MAQFGTGENALGDTDAIKAALDRRGLTGGSPALDQMSASAAGAQPPTMGAPGSIPTPGAPGAAPLPSPELGGGVAGNEEAMIIVKALDSRLKAISKTEAPAAAPAPIV